MAEEATIGGLIERIKAEGQLTRNSGTNSIKSINVTLKAFQPLLQSIQGSLTLTNIELWSIRSILAEANDLTREQMEDMKRNAELAVAPQIQPSSQPGSTTNNDNSKGGDSNLALFGGLGMLGTALSAAVGAAIGVISGQIKAIRAFAKMLTPKAIAGPIMKSIRGFAAGVSMQMDLFKAALSERITAVTTAVTNGLQRVKAFLSIGEESKLGKAIASFKSFFAPITELFTSAGKTLAPLTGGGKGGGILSKMGEVLSRISGYFKTLGSTIGRVAGIVGKIFAPIAVIMTAFDTIKGAIDGYAEGGILGGLEGAINGFFTSLITKPLDLVKSAVAWVLDKLGFDSGAEALNSFSFTTIFTDITGKIFDGIKSVGKWIMTMFSDPTEGLKQLWSTTVGAFVSIGDFILSMIDKPINWLMEKFGWKEEGDKDFSLRETLSKALADAMIWVENKAKGIGEAVQSKFNDFASFITSIPDRVTYTAKEMFINVKAKLEKGFLMFGEWFASIPARIKVAALETIRSIPGGGLLVSEDDVNAARSSVTSRQSDVAQRVQAVEDRRLAQLAELQRTAPSANVVAPTNINNGGNTTNTTTNNYYTTAPVSSSTDPAL
jgi:hypothetical protein